MMPMAIRSLPPLDANGSSLSHGAPSAALRRTGSGDGGSTTSAMAAIIGDGARVSGRPTEVRHSHHSRSHSKPRPASSSPPRPPATDVRPVGEEHGNRAVRARPTIVGGAASRTKAALGACEEHVGDIFRAVHAPAPHNSTASPALATCLMPSTLPRRAEISDAPPHLSVAAASFAPTTTVKVSERHLTPADKMNAGLRRSSMARLRTRMKVSQKESEAAVPSDPITPTTPCESDATAAEPPHSTPHGKIAEEQAPCSDRSTPPSVVLARSPSPPPAEVASLMGSGVIAEKLTTPATLSVGAAKVLPHGLQSPSAITDLGAVPLDYSGLSSVEMGLGNHVSPTRHPHPQLKLSASLAGQQADQMASSHAGSLTQTNAPFHALQFMAVVATDPIAPPPLSSRSEEPPPPRDPHQCHDLRVYGNFVPGSETDNEAGDGVPVRCQPARPTNGAAGGRSIISSPTAGDCELQSLIVCPFALAGCCVEGAHRIADLHRGSTLHHHLMAVTKHVQRMRRRQQELEQLVLGLQQQLHAQALMRREAGETLEPAQQRLTDSSCVPFSSQGPLLGRRGDLVLASASESNRRGVEADIKALPRDVSICERLVANYGMNNEDVDSAVRNACRDHAGGGSRGCRTGPAYGSRRQRSASPSICGGGDGRDRVGTFALQLRLLTSAGQEKLDVRSALSRTSGSPARVQHGRRSVPSAMPTTTTHKATVLGVQGRRGRMRCASAPKQKQQEQRRGSTKREDALRCALQPHDLHSDALEHVACSAVDGQDRGNAHKGAPTRRVAGAFSALSPSTVECSAESVDSPSRPSRSAMSPHVCYGACPSQQPGAGGSTEVSGMSNVPPYQIPNESMSPISSASLDLDDHEDDTDAGVMRQQLMSLAPMEVPVTIRADEGSLTDCTDQTGAHVMHKLGLQASPGASPRSAPSLVSVTYRPSELAQAKGGDAKGAAYFTDRLTLTSHASASVVKDRQVQPKVAAAPPFVGSLRIAAPLQRPMLVRKSDVAPPPPPNRGGADQSHVHLPPVMSPPTTFLAPAFPITDTSSILSRSDAKRPRQMSAPQSDHARVPLSRINPNASSSPLSRKSPLAVAAASGGSRTYCKGIHASCLDAFTATPLRESAAERCVVSKQPSIHAHSCRIDGDEAGEHTCGFAGSVEYALGVPRKSVRRGRGSQTRPDAAVRLPSHATSVLSPEEAADQGAALHHFGLPPRREA
ncbi:hypothetical protein LSCM1_06408 [Leishmania martiniquensis]|uniref:Uncharacterized protein n=1 Tax=Leishmania martiniquensis TaxID=1580590 RepID=A0A836KLI3_9TRYP|nr:hypothetical protein LSCM1_06408 [Leishmania martiniquensis]